MIYVKDEDGLYSADPRNIRLLNTSLALALKNCWRETWKT